ncbi:flagellar protein FlaG [Clostridium punense]|uniref:Flagellar protein FlaG n=1 Tax=Clostridium punense TaxID=1054297 RepID=A0ABS4K3K7_9CLOT|nr:MULTISPECIES: flagellar protein FlaG [Clostridium]EQB88545.1 hypothetical protein M918_03885 [Clostridium sp. BL8]MBP2021831.1 flagellar protein FlaG [Clostridium punense]
MGISEIGVGRPIEMDNYSFIIKNEQAAKPEIDNKTEFEFLENREYTEAEVQDAVRYINRFFGDSHAILRYERHEKSNIMILKLVDEETQEVLKEIPPEKIIDMVDRICELVGLAVDKKA